MKRRAPLRWILAFILATTSGLHGAAAQQEARVLDLTDTEVTEEMLQEALQPTSEPPAEFLATRGLGVAKPRPSCMRYRAGMTRGIAIKPASKTVAIKVHFAYNSAEILPEEAGELDKLGRALSSGNLALSCIRIAGHTDSIGSDAFNGRLSRERAASVVRYLTARSGIDAERLLSEGHGEKIPIASNDTEQGRVKNRRVEVTTLGYAEARP